MNTTQLECFMAVADCLNFSRAAEQLRLTQPAVSHQIRTLEDELGAVLFQRTSKIVRLTQEGHLFLQYAQQILRLTGASKAQVRQYQTRRQRPLGIGCRGAAALQLIEPALEALRQAQPQILPLPRLVPIQALDNLLAEGEIQLLLCFQETVPKGAGYRELLRCPVVCVCRADDPLAEREAVTLSQLSGAGRVIATRPPLCPPTVFAAQGQVVTTRPPDQVIFCESQEAQSALVEAGYGFAVRADFVPLRRPGLRYLPVTGCGPLSYGAAWCAGSRDPAVRDVLALLAQQLAGGEP